VNKNQINKCKPACKNWYTHADTSVEPLLRINDYNKETPWNKIVIATLNVNTMAGLQSSTCKGNTVIAIKQETIDSGSTGQGSFIPLFLTGGQALFYVKKIDGSFTLCFITRCKCRHILRKNAPTSGVLLSN